LYEKSEEKKCFVLCFFIWIVIQNDLFYIKIEKKKVKVLKWFFFFFVEKSEYKGRWEKVGCQTWPI